MSREEIFLNIVYVYWSHSCKTYFLFLIKLQVQVIITGGIAQDLRTVEKMPAYYPNAEQLLPVLSGCVCHGGNCCGGATSLWDIEVLAVRSRSDYDVSSVRFQVWI